MSKAPDAAIRILAVALFLVGFYLAWQPVRSAIATRVAAPVLADIGSRSGLHIEGRKSPASVEVTGGVGRQVNTLSIPGGLHFLLPGLILIAFAPRRLYWLGLLGLLAGLGILSFVFFALGVSGVPVGFVIHQFIQQYSIPPLSMAFPIWIIFTSPSAKSAPPGEHERGLT